MTNSNCPTCNQPIKQSSEKYADAVYAVEKEYRDLADEIENDLDLPKEDRQSMIKMYKSDADDFKKIADLIMAKKFKEAGDEARMMDTSPRESIPDDVWEFLVP